MPLEVGHAAVVGERARVAQGHDLARILPRAGGVGGCGVADVFRHTASRIEEVVAATPQGLFHQPRPLHVAVLVGLPRLALVYLGAAESLLGHVEASQFAGVGNHVAVQLQVVALRVAPHEPGLSVVVNHHGGIDVVPRAVLEERFPQRVAEGPRGRVGHGHADGHASGQLRVGADVPEELAVALDALRRPGAVVGPGERFECQRRAVVAPVHHVGGGVDAPLLHPEEVGTVFVVTGVDVEAVAHHQRRRVAGEARLHKGVLPRGLNRCCHGGGHEKGFQVFHVMQFPAKLHKISRAAKDFGFKCYSPRCIHANKSPRKSPAALLRKKL